MSDFARRIIRWQRAHGRHDLPWQGTRDAYAIWLSEIMLQQTQVATVIPYYQRFRARFPDIDSLAAADEDEVLRCWSGLGYYSRARNLHQAAQHIVARHRGDFPRSLTDISALPGVGPSTAAAIAAFAFGVRAAILDGNVKRVLARHFVIAGSLSDRVIMQRLWELAESLLPARDIEAYTQGLMDLGAGVCTTRTPQCARCPVRTTCGARAQDRIGELPNPRPRRRVPTRQTTMVVLRHGEEVLLEKRAPIGVWGGLWSLPELAEGDEPKKAMARRYGCEVVQLERLTLLRHGFTHFTLEITPLLATVARITPRVGQPGVLWVAIDDALDAALPMPIRKLLRRLGGDARSDQATLFEA
jgi:A/G-specific adenine glycosylase